MRVDYGQWGGGRNNLSSSGPRGVPRISLHPQSVGRAATAMGRQRCLFSARKDKSLLIMPPFISILFCQDYKLIRFCNITVYSLPNHRYTNIVLKIKLSSLYTGNLTIIPPATRILSAHRRDLIESLLESKWRGKSLAHPKIVKKKLVKHTFKMRNGYWRKICDPARHWKPPWKPLNWLNFLVSDCWPSFVVKRVGQMAGMSANTPIQRKTLLWADRNLRWQWWHAVFKPLSKLSFGNFSATITANPGQQRGQK